MKKIDTFFSTILTILTIMTITPVTYIHSGQVGYQSIEQIQAHYLSNDPVKPFIFTDVATLNSAHIHKKVLKGSYR